MSCRKILSALAFLSISSAAYGCDGTWTGGANTDWSNTPNTANWTLSVSCAGEYPGFVTTGGDTATFNSAGGTVLANVSGITITTLTFNSSNSYTIEGADPLILQGVGVSTATLDVMEGTHTFNNPISLGNMDAVTLTINPSSGTVLNLNQPVGDPTHGSSLILTGSGQINVPYTGTATGVTADIAFTLNMNSDGVFNCTSTTTSVSAEVGVQITSDSFTISSGTINLTNMEPVTATAPNNGASGVVIAVPSATPFAMNGGVINITNTAAITGNNADALALGAGINCRSFTMTGGTINCVDTGTHTAFASGITILSDNGILLQGGTIFNNGGSLTSVDGVAAMTVSPGATLAVTNNGTIGSLNLSFQSEATEVTNNGTLIPGDLDGQPGIANVIGTYTQSSTGTFTVSLKNVSTFSQLQVSNPTMGSGGVANLDGTMIIQASDGYSLANGDSFIVLNAATAMNGTFATITNLLPPGYVPTVLYNDPSVEILIATNFGSTTITTFPGSFVETTISFVNQFNQLNQMDRLQRFACPVEDEKECCPIVKKGKWQKPSAPCIEEKTHDCEPRPWNVYFGPLGTVGGECHTKKDQIGFNYKGIGGLVGADYVWDHFGIGLVFAYEHINADVHRHWGKFHVDELHGSLYAKYAPAPVPELAFNGIVGGSYEFYKVDRNVDFPSFGIHETAKGKPRGSEFDSLFGLEYTVKIGDHGKLLPLAQVQYIYAAVKKYNEHHAGIYDLTIHSQFVKSLRSALGLRGNYTWRWEDFSFTPQANVVWQREFFDKDRNLYVTSATFTEPNVALGMPGIGRNIILAGIDLVATWYERYSVEGRYNFEWNSQFHDHFLYLGVDFRF